MSPERRIEQLRVVGKQAGARVVIEFDDGETLTIDPEIAVQHGLKSGTAISDELIEQLNREDEALRARRRLTRYLSLRVKSVADARFYLEQKGFSEAAIAEAVEDAIARDMLNDRRFAERYVRTRLKTATYGPLRLLAELLSHGIDQPLAEEILQPQFDIDWQRQAAETLARKRLGEKPARDKAAARKRLRNWLHQRGFEDEIVSEVVERVVQRT